jgi:hypothetical protein
MSDTQSNPTFPEVVFLEFNTPAEISYYVIYSVAIYLCITDYLAANFLEGKIVLHVRMYISTYVMYVCMYVCMYV